MSQHGGLKTSGAPGQHQREKRAASRDGWRIKPRNDDPSIEHRPHYLAASQPSGLPNFNGPDTQSRSLSKTATARHRHPHIDHAWQLLGPIEAKNGLKAQVSPGRAVLWLIVSSAVATALILVSNALQRTYGNESQIGIPGQHARGLSGDAFEAGSFAELNLAKPSNHVAMAAVVADDVVTEHRAIVGLTNFDQQDFKSSNIDTEAATSLDERNGVVGASLSPKNLQRPPAGVEPPSPAPSSSQKFDRADISPRELVPPAPQGGPKIELDAFEPSIPRPNAIAPHFRVQIAAVRDKADAQRVWAKSQTDLGVILADLEPQFERAETSNGVFYRIQAGPFQSRSEADQICARLRERDVTCFVVAL